MGSAERRPSLGASPVLRIEAGRKVRGCRYCGREVTRPRLYWCSQACIDEHGLLSHPSSLRGPCELCGLDADKLERILTHALRSLMGGWTRGESPSGLARELLGREFPHSLAWAETDHRMPLSEGGPHEVQNLRRLCVPCHRTETAALRKRLADRRVGQVSLL